MTRKNLGGRRITAFLTMLAVCHASCAIIPYPVISDRERFDHVHLAADTLVSASPRDLLDRLSKRLEKAHPGLTVVDPIVFRDTAFPDGGWRVQELLDPDRCARVADELDVRFVVLVGAGAEEVRDEMGIMLPMMMPLGAMTMSRTNVLSAVVLDLETGTPACQFRSEADGPSFVFAWVIFLAIIFPASGWSAERGLGKALVDYFANETEGEPLQIAVMAAQASGDPFVAYEGAPITVGRDIAVGEMVNRLAEIELDATPGITSREDIQSLFSLPLASHPDHRVELYRFSAVVDNETSPLIYLGYFDWTAREERRYAGYLLIAYDSAWKVVDIESVFVAGPRQPREPSGGSPFSDRSGYNYDFEREVTASVDGFRVEIEHRGDDTRERLYSDPDGELIFDSEE